MFKAILILICGILIGLAVAHFVFGPIDWSGVREQTGEAMSDAATTAAVRSALALQKDFDLFGDVEVSATAGVVTLSGRVDTQQQRELAVLISRGVHGVDEVIDKLEVRPEDSGGAPPEMQG